MTDSDIKRSPKKEKKMSPIAISESGVKTSTNPTDNSSERGLNNFRQSVGRLKKKIAARNLATVQIPAASTRPIDELDIALGNIANNRWDK